MRVYVGLAKLGGRDEYPHPALASTSDALTGGGFVVAQSIGERVHDPSLTNKSGLAQGGILGRVLLTGNAGRCAWLVPGARRVPPYTCALPLDLCARPGVVSLVLVPRRSGGQMERYDLTAASRRAAAEMIGTTGPVSPSGTYDALVELLAAAYREGVMAGLQLAKDILSERVES